MKIDNQDIAQMARQLRDEENSALHVRPWPHHHRHFSVPSWLVAIPAAAFIGFFFGLWTQSNTKDTAALTSLVDTVYIEVPVKPTVKDTAEQTVAPVPVPADSKGVRHTPAVRRTHPVVGRPVSSDQIRYDLLVRN